MRHEIYSRGAELWEGCSDSGSDSDSDSGLLIDSDFDFDSDSDTDSGSDKKYRINNTLIVGQVSMPPKQKKRYVT